MMTIDNKDMDLIFEAIHKVQSGEMNKLKAFNSIKDKCNIKQNSFYTLCEKIAILNRLQYLNVEDYIIDDLSSQLKIFFIWRLYNE